MDVYCATCLEPWDHHHMLHDMVWDVWDGEEDSSSHLMVKKFLNSDRTKIAKSLREALQEEGWVFGKAVVTIMECPCCNGGFDDSDEAIKERKGLRLQCEELLGNDLDGLISQLNTVDNYAGS